MAYSSAPPASHSAPPRLRLDPLKTWFDQADAKHLGYLDREAFRADAVRVFKQLDENGDGVIDGFEVADYEHKLVPELGEEAEGRLSGLGGDRAAQSSGPGSGQPGQGRQGGGRHHGGGQEAGDQNRTGQNADGPDRSSGGKPPASRISQLIGEPEPVSGADFNLDSRITLAEWMRATDQRFDILDQAKTGRLTLDELRARFKALSR